MSMLKLFFHRNGKVCTLEVQEYDTIRSLPFFNEQIKVVANSQILSPAFSFAFYQLKEGDHIYVVEREKPILEGEIKQVTKYMTPPELLGPRKRERHFIKMFGYVPDSERMQAIVDEMTDHDIQLSNFGGLLNKH